MNNKVFNNHLRDELMNHNICCYLLPVVRRLEWTFLPEMNDRVEEGRLALVTNASGLVTPHARPLCDVEESQVLPRRLTVSTNLQQLHFNK